MLQLTEAIVRGDEPSIEFLPETRRWRARDVRYFRGRWDVLRSTLPQFELRAFSSSAAGAINPFYQSVVRLPLTRTEMEIPVGIVSQSYNLIQHREIGDFCVEVLSGLGFSREELSCEVGLSELGEWANLRFELPDRMQFCPPDGHPLALRLEIFNSVEGSTKLTALMSWLRLVCSNGMIARGTMTKVADRHDPHLDLDLIRDAIEDGIQKAQADQRHLQTLSARRVADQELIAWVDGPLQRYWGVKAATRALHICRQGIDVDLADPFDGGRPSERNVLPRELVPGAPVPARTRYDVAQALSWIASHRNDAERRIALQIQIPRLLGLISRTRDRDQAAA